MPVSTNSEGQCEFEFEIESEGGYTAIATTMGSIEWTITRPIEKFYIGGAGGGGGKVGYASQCFKDVTLSGSIYYTPTEDESFLFFRDWIEQGGGKGIRIYFPRYESGAQVLAGSFKLEELSTSMDAGSAAPLSFNFSCQSHGEVNFETFVT